MNKYASETYAKKSSSLTSTNTVLKGVFELSRAAVPFYAANISLDQIEKQELKLVEEMPADYRANWSLEELFQRDLDRERVDTELVTGYLKRQEKRTFFNSLTVALLPKSPDGELAAEYGDTDSDFPQDGPFGDEAFKLTEIGGIQVASAEDSDVAFLRWDETRIFPATIDGQHRLKALRKFLADAPLTTQQRNTKIPVLFLVLDERLGFKQTNQPSVEGINPLLTVVREIFIDLNKHAREVSQARQILLNDQEIESVCTRALLADRVGESTASELPLGIVNWQNDKIKFDDGPSITSVTGLYQIVREILGIKYPMKDPADPKLIKQFVDSLESALNISEQIKLDSGDYSAIYKNETELMQFVKENYLGDNGLPFRNIPQTYVWAARDSFCRQYKPLITSLFMEHVPYKEFWEAAANSGGVDGDLAYYLGQPKHQRLVLEQEHGEAVYKDTIAGLAALKKGKWAFQVVFQKALVIGSFEAKYQASVVLKGEASDADFDALWISFLNRCYGQGLFDTSKELPGGSREESGELWEGIAKNPATRTIKYSNAAANRIKDLLRLAWYFDLSAQKDASAFLSELAEKGSEAKWPAGRRCANNLGKSIASVATSRGIEDAGEVKDFADKRLCCVLEQFDVS